MEKDTQKLLEKLAEKLGTTTEYLWEILVKQAYVSSLTLLFQMCLIPILAYLLYRVYKKNIDEYGDIEDLGVSIVLAAGFVFTIFLTLIAFFEISNMVNGFVNPEYWALDKILETLK